MNALSCHVVMLGPAMYLPGGMTEVAQILKDEGLFARRRVFYISTYIGPGTLRQLRCMTAATFSLLGLLIFGKVRLVHAHSASRGSFWRKSILCGICRLFRVPYVFHIHSGEFDKFFLLECSAIGQWVVSQTVCAAASVICLGDTWKCKLSNLFPTASITIVGNPVSVIGVTTIAADTPRKVLFLGRLRRSKGIFDLIQAIPVVLQSYPALQFVLAGDDLDCEVRRAVDELDLWGNVSLPGWVAGEQKKQLLSSSNIFVLPSYFEGLPLGILEAMAFGVSVVATKVGGIPDLIESNVHGLLVPSGDVGALAGAICRLCSNDADRFVMRQNAYLRVKSRYSAEVVAEALEDIYDRVANSHK